MSAPLETLAGKIAARFPDAVKSHRLALGELKVYVDRASILPVLSFLREEPTCLFKQLMVLTAVDYPENAERFEVVYHLLSLKHNLRVCIALTTDEEHPVPTVSTLFPVANWLEREVYDFYGVFFEGHPDLRRILTDYGFDGHPLRKDFPLTGYVEVRYDHDKQRVVNEPVVLNQEFRRFDFLSPWEGPEYHIPLPGDEKANVTLPPEKKGAA